VYAGQIGSFPSPTRGRLVIEDVSDYQFRRPNPQIRIVSKLFWTDQDSRGHDPLKSEAPAHISTNEPARERRGRLAAACARERPRLVIEHHRCH